LSDISKLSDVSEMQKRKKVKVLQKMSNNVSRKKKYKEIEKEQLEEDKVVDLIFG
jgi:hypothetical protein